MKSPSRKCWKLVHTYLNYRVLGIRTAAICLSNDHFLCAPIYLGWTSCLISFVWDQSTCQECVEIDPTDLRKVCGIPTGNAYSSRHSFTWICSNCWDNFAKLFPSDIPQYFLYFALKAWNKVYDIWHSKQITYEIVMCLYFCYNRQSIATL